MATNVKHQSRLILAALCLAGLALIAASCGEDEPELTMAERLANVEGRELTEAELEDRLAVGNTLCGMDDAVLDGIWRQLNERQLNYQDVVFGQMCADRSVFYASLTGRYVTEEAIDSGVVPSTTRPPLTTIAPSSSTATTTAPPVSSESSVVGSEDDPATDEDGVDDDSSTTAAPTASTTTTAAVTTTTEPATTTVVTTTEPATSTSATVDGEGG